MLRFTYRNFSNVIHGCQGRANKISEDHPFYAKKDTGLVNM